MISIMQHKLRKFGNKAMVVMESLAIGYVSPFQVEAMPYDKTEPLGMLPNLNKLFLIHAVRFRI